jgi:Cu(I)-responsive transcriptional regulator
VPYAPCSNYRVKAVAEHLTIGKLASATGVNVETIRYYERSGLVSPPARTEGNYRSYKADDVARLRFIRRTRDLGFSLEQVRALLGISGQRDRDCGTVDAIATEHLAEVDRKIADLRALRRELADAVASCAGGTIAECRILEAFSPMTRR